MTGAEYITRSNQLLTVLENPNQIFFLDIKKLKN